MPTPVSTLTEFVRSRVESLGLSPHPEGGFYREVYRSYAVLPLPRGKRTLLTVIHFVLPPGGFSAWHVVRSDEVWTWAAGDVVWLHRLDDTGKHSVVELGGDFTRGETVVAVVPAGLWQAAECLSATGAHVTCAVAPGFDFADFRMGGRDELAARFPQHRALVERLTRG